MTTGKRITWVDNAKALGMLLVFWGHMAELGAYVGKSDALHAVTKAIYACHMPFFFFLAGLFYRESTVRFGVLLVRKAKARLVPVLFFALMGTALSYQYTQLGWLDPAEMAGRLQQLKLLLVGKTVVSWTCWFLTCLFVLEMIASELVPVLTSRWKHLLAIAVAGGVGVVILGDATYMAQSYLGWTDKEWWFLQTGSSTALVFYLAGIYCQRYLQNSLPAATGRAWGPLIAAVIVFYFTFDRNFADGLGMVNMSGSIYGDWWWFWPAAFSGTLAIVHVASLLPANRLLDYIGANTIPLLGINGIMLWACNPLFWTWCLPYLETPWIVPLTLLVAVLSLLVCLPLVWLLSRCVPVLVGHWK